jgi:hypothetical protein
VGLENSAITARRQAAKLISAVTHLGDYQPPEPGTDVAGRRTTDYTDCTDASLCSSSVKSVQSVVKKILRRVAQHRQPQNQ